MMPSAAADVHRSVRFYGRDVARRLLDVLEGKNLMNHLTRDLLMGASAEECDALVARVRAIRAQLGHEPPAHPRAYSVVPPAPETRP